MKKIIALSIAIILIYFLYPKKDSKEIQDDQISVEKNIKETKISAVKDKQSIKKYRPVKAKRTLAQNEIYASFSDLMSNYSKKKINFFTEAFYLIEGVYVSTVDIPQLKKITKFQNFFIYEGESDDQMRLIYSADKKRHGVFTGEVTVFGAMDSVIDILERNSFQIIYKNELSQKVIFQVKNVNQLDFLNEIKTLPGLKKIEPDLKYSKLKSID